MSRIKFLEQCSVGAPIESGIFFGVLGFERRATYVFDRFVRTDLRHLICAYGGIYEFSFNDNLMFYTDRGAKIVKAEDFVRNARLMVSSLVENGAVDNSIDVHIDISSMTRSTLADLIAMLDDFSSRVSVELSIYYAEAEFERPPRRFPPIKESAPIHPAFCAYPTHIGRPTKLILGLGYEGGRSIAAIEEFEVNNGWILFPHGRDHQYDDMVREANRGLIDSQHKFHVVDYNISEPSTICSLINQIIRSAKAQSRPVLVPFGPKILTACALIVLLQYPGDATVWRMSGGVGDAVMDRRPSGQVTVFRVEIQKKDQIASMVAAFDFEDHF